MVNGKKKRLLGQQLVFKQLFNQNLQDMRSFFTSICLFVAAISVFFSCQGDTGCQDITGSWSDREGHNFVFQNNNKALWINKFGQLIDTVTCAFVLNCNKKPATLDFKDFKGGPFMGKSLFGIIDWSADSLFRYCYEVGSQPDSRPKEFDQEQTMKFFRLK